MSTRRTNMGEIVVTGGVVALLLAWLLGRVAESVSAAVSNASTSATQQSMAASRAVAEESSRHFATLAETLLKVINPPAAPPTDDEGNRQHLDIENHTWWNSPAFDPTGPGLDPTDARIWGPEMRSGVAYIEPGTDILAQLQNGHHVAAGVPDLTGELFDPDAT